MLQKLRQRYPQVALISELVQIDHGKYIVKAIVEIEGKTVVTGLAAADTVEIAEDRARERALLLLEAESTPDLQLVEKVSPNNISLPSD
jgi:3-keto-L-gulonate-6-phosphate decarboxylase